MKFYCHTFKHLFIAFLLCFTTVSWAQLAGSYTIDANTSRTNSNFQSFLQLTTALDSHGVSAPIIVNVVVGSGPYTEGVAFSTINGVSAINNITINGNGETIQYNLNTNEGRVFTIDSSKHIILDSLTIKTGGNIKGIGVYFSRHADSNIVRNCTIDISSVTTHPSFNVGPSAGIYIGNPIGTPQGPRSSNYITIDNNIIVGDSITIGGPYAGINLQGDACIGHTITNNTISNFFNSGILAEAQDSLLIKGNIISKPKTAGANPTGIVLKEFSKNCTIENNRITKMHEMAAGIACNNNRLNYADPNYVINNMIYDNPTKEGAGISVISCHAFFVLHNSISFDDTAPSNFFFGGSTTGIVASGGLITVKNNNVNISNNGDGMKIGLNIGFNSFSMTFDHNNIYVFSNSNVEQYYGELLGSSNRYETLADWRSANLAANNAQNSTSLDPLFRMPSDLTPTNIYLNNLGENVGIKNDINQMPRDSMPDIGAIEFDSTAVSGISYPYHPVGIINSQDVLGYLDSANLRCRTTGTIVGVDMDTNFSFRYFLIDQSLGSTQEGITLQGFEDIPNSRLQEGDSVEVLGTVLQKTGNPYLSVHSIRVIKTNCTLPQPIVVDSISELVTGKLVEIKNSTLTRRFFYGSTYDFYLAKNNLTTQVYVNPTGTILDTVNFASNWFLGDSLCSIKGVVVQDVFQFFPTRVGYVIYPRYAADLDKNSCYIITAIEKMVEEKATVKLFPNPSNGIFQIAFSGEGLANKHLEVYDVTAKLVYQKTLSDFENLYSIDLAHLEAGVYFIKLTSNNVNETLKVLVQD